MDNEIIVSAPSYISDMYKKRPTVAVEILSKMYYYHQLTKIWKATRRSIGVETKSNFDRTVHEALSLIMFKTNVFLPGFHNFVVNHE